MKAVDINISYTETSQRKNNVDALWRLQQIILDTLDFNQVVQKIVNALLTELGYLDLGYRIIVLTLVNTERGVLQRIALSSTPEAARAQEASPIPFHNIEIPLQEKDNMLVRVINEKKPYLTHEWPELFSPVLTAEQATKNQTAAGIKTSMVFPVVVHNDVIGALIFSMVKEESEISEEEKELIRGFTEIVGIAIQNSRLYSSLEKTSEELKVANEKLQDVDKLKDEFVSLASHELRTPMSIIKSYTWVLLQGKIGDFNEKQKTYLSRIASTTDRLINLVNDMLNVSRIESGRFTIELAKVDIGKLASDIATEMQTRAAEFGITIVYQPVDSLPQVKADLERTKQVLINLIGNSLKFTPKMGTIAISLVVVDEDFVRVSVADNGRGISTPDLQKLFQKFNMVGKANLTKQVGQGTGLGLYLSKSLIELQGGRIWASSPGEGKGSVFSFTLPIWTEASIQAV